MSRNQTKAGTSPSDPYANDYVIATMLVDLFLTFENQGLATMSSWQPLISMRVFIGIDQIDHVDPG